MSYKIVYESDDGGVVILTPTSECLAKHTINEIADKDVPFGKPYKIIDISDIPNDRTFRNAWEIVINEPDGFGAESNEFQEKA